MDDNALCILKMSGGALGTMAASWTVYGHECQSTVLYGTKGLMMIYSEPSAPIIINDLEGNRTRFAFENIVPEWLAMPRAASTALYFGLGAYRIGEGDGGANEDSQSQWCTGSALARQVERLHSLGAGGWALYRYDSLFGPARNDLAAAECAALTAQNGETR